MALFPFFISLRRKKVLVVGAGSVAERKIGTLLAFEPDITVVAKEIKSKVIKELATSGELKLIERSFINRDIDGFDVVIVAANNLSLQKEIFDLCTKKNIYVNCVDQPDYCSFIFPSVIVRGDMVIGITTSTKAPTISKRMRESIEKLIPANVEELIESINKIRKDKRLNRNEKMKLIYDLTDELILGRDND